MGNRVQMTPQIAAKLQSAVGADANVADYAVFEAIALNTLPLNQRGSIFNGGRVGVSTLAAMLQQIQAGDRNVPIHLMHDTGALPVGRVFAGELNTDANGVTSLKAMFFISSTEPDLIQKLDEGTVPEVSSGFAAAGLLCSACQFDYMGADATPDMVWSQTCANGHTIGQEGAHLVTDGLTSFYELSLVGQGAAQGAKIVKQDQVGYRMAASADGAKRLVLTLSATPLPKPEITKMDLTQLTAQLAALSEEKGALVAKLTTAEAQVTALTAELSTVSTELAARVDPAPIQAELDAANAFLTDVFKNGSIALGNLNPTVPATSAALIEGIKALQPNLAATFVAGGKSVPADAPENKRTVAPASAFSAHPYTGKR